MDNKKEEIVELTEKDLEIYKTEFLFWVDIFGLRGWSFYFKLDDLKGNYGDILYSMVGRTSTVRLNKKMEKELYSIEQVKQTAFHECCELFLGRLVSLAEYRYTTADEIEEETHNIIRTLEYIKDNYTFTKKV